MPGRTTIVRPGLIVGPGDPWTASRTGRSGLRRGRGARPGTPQDPTQFIDVRDLGAWIVLLLEKNRTGVYNATGPKEPLPMASCSRAAKRVSGSDRPPSRGSLRPFLEAQQVAPWSDMPVWVRRSTTWPASPGSASRARPRPG